MRFPGLLPALEADPAVRATLRDSQVVGAEARDITCATSFFATATAMLASESGRTILLVTSTFREAEAIAAEISGLLGEDAVAYYPAWETLPHERLSPRADTVGRRLAVLRRLVSDAPPRVVVAPVRALLQPQVKDLASMRPVTVEAGRERDLTDLLKSLVDAAYNRVDLVERRGEFAVRGGIVDVFPPTEQPMRIDFFGDEVTEIRPFSVADQRSTGEQLQRVTAEPCRELLLTDAVRRRAAALQLEHPQLSDMLSRLAEGHAVEGMEALIPVLVDGLEMLTDVLPPRSLVLVAAPELVRARAVELVATSEEFLNASWAAAASGGTSPIDLGASSYRALGEVREHTMALGHKWWSLSPFTVEEAPDANLDAGSVHSRQLGITPTDDFRGDVDTAVAHIQARLRDGWRLLIGVEGKGLANRMAELLAEHDITARVS